MSKQQSELLTQFYKDYLAWVENGAPALNGFTASYGLCYNLVIWCRANNQSWFEVALEMSNQFKRADLDRRYPFNDSMWPADDYTSEGERQEMHLNEKRIAWVKSHV